VIETNIENIEKYSSTIDLRKAQDSLIKNHNITYFELHLNFSLKQEFSLLIVIVYPY